MSKHSLYLVEMFSGIRGEQVLYVSQRFFNELAEELRSLMQFTQEPHKVGFDPQEIRINTSYGALTVRGPGNEFALYRDYEERARQRKIDPEDLPLKLQLPKKD